MPDPTPTDFPDTDECAKRMGRKPSTLRQWRYQGIGPPYLKFDGNISYFWPDVVEWMMAHTVRPGEPPTPRRGKRAA